MIRSLGKARVRSTSLDWRSELAFVAETELKEPDKSAKGSRVKDLFWSNSIRSIGDL